jgi:hypothetical protein
MSHHNAFGTTRPVFESSKNRGQRFGRVSEADCVATKAITTKRKRTDPIKQLAKHSE